MRAALDELRGELGESRVELSELVILGAQTKLAAIRAQRQDVASRRKQLAERIRRHDLPADVEAAEEVRRAGWARP